MADPVDEAIDRALREMMSADPRPGLRHRVTARLEAAPRRWMQRPALAGALAVAGLAALVFVSRGPTVVPPRTPTPTITLERPAAVGTRAAGNSTPARSIPRSGSSEPRVRRVKHADRRAWASTNTFETTIEIAPLETILPITTAEVHPPQISTTEIRISPLGLERLDIEPLAEPR